MQEGGLVDRPSPQKLSLTALWSRARNIIERGDAAALIELCQRQPELLTTKTDSVYRPTLLHVAAVKGKRALARLLVDMGAHVDAVDARGETALCWCCTIARFNKRSADLAADLVRLGSDVNLRDVNRRHALMHAVVRGSDDAVRRKRVELLLRLGADPLIRDAQGKRALDLLGCTTDDGVVWYEALPGCRKEVEKCRQMLQAEMDRRTVRLLLLLVRRSLFGAEWTKGASDAQKPAVGQQARCRRTTRSTRHKSSSTSSETSSSSASLSGRAGKCLQVSPDTVAGRLVCMADKAIFRHIMEYF